MPSTLLTMPEHAETTQAHDRPFGGRRWLLVTVRYLVPAAVVLAGGVIMALGGEANVEGGAGVVSAGLAVWLLNWLFRTGAAGDRDRDAEDAAREYFDRHGRWPD